MNRPLALAAAALVIVPFLAAATAAAAAAIPSDPGSVRSLDGTWRFKIEQLKGYDAPGEMRNPKLTVDYPATFEPFNRPDYKEGDGWHDIKVPGNWEMPGFSPATYNQPDNTSGFYRLEFDVPADWEGRDVRVNFDGVQNAAEIWLNGQPVNVDEPSWGRANYHEGGWTAFQADLTPHVKFGGKNLLALRVTKNSKSADLDTGDYFFLGGIHRPVTLFTVPKDHLEDVTVQTRLLEGGKAEVKVIASVAGSAGSISVSLDGVNGAAEAKFDGGKATATKVIDNPKFWSAEFPNLYPMTVELKDPSDKPIEHVSQKIGVREITIKDGVVLLNGKPVKFAGMCRHDVSPQDGTAVGPDLWRKDIELMKAANVNAIRTSHYPYGKGFYDLCDELGMYVMDELPYCWTPTNEKDMQPAFLQRARETVRRDKNHPCVIVWAVGNENKEGQNLQAVADLVKQLDPTRLRLVSWFDADKYKTELSDSHYTKPDAIEKAAAKAKKDGHPHVYLENPNDWEIRVGADPGGWERWGPVLQRCWDVVTKYDTIPGTFNWEWQDRAVADKSPTKFYYFDEKTGINLLKIKGIVDGFRNPRPWYYEVKMIYSPIRFGETLNTGADGKASFEVENRYSFTDLSQLKAKWQLLASGKPVAEGERTVAQPPLSKGTADIALPADGLARADALRIDFIHPDGRDVVAHQYALKPADTASKIAGPLAGDAFPEFNLVTRKTQSDPKLWRKVTRYPAKLTNVQNEAGAGGAAKKLTADVIGGPNNSIVGKLRAEYAGDRLTYHLDWTGAKAEVQEVGWAFHEPGGHDHFSWDRAARWTVYPGKHISRPAGTATPDSMNVSYTKMDRPDAFDFNSTKYDCNWASLTDAGGDGMRAEFDPKQRFHCRGGVAGDGRTILFVNQQVSPPDDISSNVVRDLYMTLKPGDKVEGEFRVGVAKK